MEETKGDDRSSTMDCDGRTLENSDLLVPDIQT